MKKGSCYIRKILAGLLLIAGIVAIGTSIYIMKQVEEGQMKIESAEDTLQKSDQLFSLNPVTKELGKGITGSAQQKIDAGKDQIEHYTKLSSYLKIAGIVLIIVGVGLFLLPRKKEK